MRYYEKEHFDAYARIRRGGLDQWSDLHPADSGRGYDAFPSRSFLTRVLPANPAGTLSVLEYGCGTGGAACFLASRGYRVDAVDLVPDAIAIARARAAERGAQVRFAVADVCQWGEPSEQYDYVVDGFCLQSIVTDADRERVFAAVRRRLRSGGRYLILTAMYSADRVYDDDDHYDPTTGTVWTRADADVDGGTMINGSWYVPNRRHLTAQALRAELEQHGFRILDQSGPTGGEVVCGIAG
jgi:SAM-dependent methyltransferase